jgi:hypothetical protein
MVIAQVASEVTMLSRRMDAFLSTSKPVLEVTEAGAKARPKGDCIPEAVMPNRLVALFRTYIRSKICKNPLGEAKGVFHKTKRTREAFFASSVVDGGSLAFDFFKSLDPATATAQLQMYTPLQGVSKDAIVHFFYRISTHLFIYFQWNALTSKNFRNLKSELNKKAKKV